MHACKICKVTEGVVGLRAGRAHLGFFCARHTEMIKGTVRLGTSLAGMAFKAYLMWKHPKIWAALQKAIEVATPPPGDYPTEPINVEVELR